jgi:hypothetical protein
MCSLGTEGQQFLRRVGDTLRSLMIFGKSRLPKSRHFLEKLSFDKKKKCRDQKGIEEKGLSLFYECSDARLASVIGCFARVPSLEQRALYGTPGLFIATRKGDSLRV